MSEAPTKLSGVVESLSLSASKYGGSFGEIQGDDGKMYVWSAGHVFRNGSHPAVGVRVTFKVIGHGSYATNIDTVNA